MESGAEEGRIQASFAWNDPTGARLLTERRLMRFSRSGEDNVVDLDIRETTVRVESRCRQDSAGELRVRSRLAPAGSCQFGCGTTFSVVAGC